MSSYRWSGGTWVSSVSTVTNNWNDNWTFLSWGWLLGERMEEIVIVLKYYSARSCPQQFINRDCLM